MEHASTATRRPTAPDAAPAAPGGSLTIGTLEEHELSRMLAVLAQLDVVQCCLVALRGTAGRAARLIGTVNGVPPAGETLLSWVSPDTATVRRLPEGWIAPIVQGTEVTGAVLVDGSDETQCERLALAVARAAQDILVASAPDVGTAGALRALVGIGEEVHAVAVDLDAVLRSIVDRAHELIGADVTWLALADHERDESRVSVVRGARTPGMSTLRVSLGEGITGLALSAMDVVTLDDERHADSRLPPAVHECFAAEGIVSLVCAPVFHQGLLTGSLLIGFRRRAAVPRDAQYLLSALSSQAATAIAHSRLYTSLREQNALLEQHVSLGRILTEASLAGGGQHAIARELARAIGVDVVVEREGEGASVCCYPTAGSGPRPVENGVSSVAHPDRAVIQAGGEHLGYVWPAGAAAITEFHRAALGLGATAIALEITKEHAALEAEWRVRGELLEELLQAGDRWSDSLRRRAVHAGIDVAEPRAVAVFEALPGSEASALYSLVRSAATASAVMVGRRGEHVIAALPGGQRPADWVHAVVERAGKKGIPVRAGLSDSYANLDRALREATAGLGLARKSGRAGAVVRTDALGPLRFLLDAPDTTQMTDMVRRTLGRLAAYDRDRHTDLLPTLRAFLEAGGNHPATAERCNVHLNTVKYRLGRVSEVLQCHLAEPSVRFELTTAFAVADILQALGFTPFGDGS